MLSETELHQLIQDLRTQTPLGRLNVIEAEAVFAGLAELGYQLKAVAPEAARPA